MEKENLSTIWPILYFEADWSPNIPSFELGVQLIKADKTLLEEITDSDYFRNNIDAAFNTRDNTQWFLAMHRPEITEHISVNEIGMSFVDTLQKAIKESFLMTLQLVRSTAAICPFDFHAEIQEDSIVEADTNMFIWGLPSSDKPDVYLPDIFAISDLQLITDLWSAIIKLRKLDYWASQISKEEFFADLDKKAGEDAVKKFADMIMRSVYLEFPEEERKQHKEKWTVLAKEALNKGEEFLKEFYKDSFQKVFWEKQEEVFSNRTRIGRALNLFFEGLHLPLQHSFLSMCLVLETLFTVDEGETTHKLTTRLAKIIGRQGIEGKEERKEIYKRAKKVYDERSKIVHGDKLIDNENAELLKDAFFFARQGLQRILLAPKLLALYSDPGTTDKKVKGKLKEDAKNAIREYFLDLDLQCD